MMSQGVEQGSPAFSSSRQASETSPFHTACNLMFRFSPRSPQTDLATGTPPPGVIRVEPHDAETYFKNGMAVFFKKNKYRSAVSSAACALCDDKVKPSLFQQAPQLSCGLWKQRHPCWGKGEDPGLRGKCSCYINHLFHLKKQSQPSCLQELWAQTRPFSS